MSPNGALSTSWWSPKLAWLLSCQHADLDTRRRGAIVAALVLALAGLSFIAFVIFIALGSKLSECVPDLISAAIFTALFFDNRRGNIERCSYAALTLILALINLFSLVILQDAIGHYVLAYMLIIPILLAGALMSWRTVALVTSFCVANTWLVYFFVLRSIAVLEGVSWKDRTMQATLMIITAGALCVILRYQTDRYQKELRERNEQLNRLNGDLEQEVLNRTSDLVIARDTALAASRTKSEILVNMSHELRTPLTSILGNTDLLLDTSLENRQREFAADTRASGHALLLMIDDILEYSSLDLGSNQVEERTFDVRAWFQSTLAPLEHTAKTKGLEFKATFEGIKSERLITDTNHLRRILTNLVSNAIKFTNQGEVLIRVSVESTENEQASLKCSVQDTGIGIASERLNKIFEVFGQIDASLKRRFSGIGLGLALSKRLAEKLGGQLTAISKENEGSTFSFIIPVKISAREIQTAPSPINAINAPISAKYETNAVESAPAPGQILLAEDNLINQKVALMMLKKLGHVVDVVSNGLQAIEAARKKQYDLILMDIQMPEMDGLEATRQILVDPALNERPIIIAFTAHVLDADKQRCIDVGMLDVISKPIDLATMQATISRYLERHRQEKNAQSPSQTST